MCLLVSRNKLKVQALKIDANDVNRNKYKYKKHCRVCYENDFTDLFIN